MFSSLASDPSGASIPTALGAALTNLQSAVGDLYAAGARTILMPNMPDLGQTPDFSGSPAAAQLTTAVATFDAGLTTLEMALEAALSGLDIIDFDTFGALNKLIANPAGYGLSNVTQPCFNGATVCGDPGSYLFWDGVHPTTAADAILAGLFTTAVLPEPPTTALVLLALIVVFASRQRRSL